MASYGTRRIKACAERPGFELLKQSLEFPMTDNPYQIGLTLRRLVLSYGDAAELFKAVRKVHPDASKKDIVLAALGVMIDQSETDEVAAKRLQALALENRGGR